jgi:prepilin-type N-terminal cleavage/methylation domain-containing protein
MVRPHVQTRAAFSLIELLIALVIMGVMAAAIAPSLSEVLADNRQGTAAQDLVRLSRRARALAMGSGVAHLLRFQHATINGNLGGVELFAGMNSRCAQTPWALALSLPPADPRLRAIEVFDMAPYNGWDGVGAAPTDADVGRQVITLRATLGASVNDTPVILLCYQPNGDSYATASGDPATLGKQSLSILFTLARFVRTTSSTVPHGRDRQVMFPVGGTARAR